VAGTKISKKGKEIDTWYSGKTHGFGGNAQALMDAHGDATVDLRCVPRLRNDLTVARELVLAILWPYTKTMPVLADGGYNGAGCGVLAPSLNAPTVSRCTPTSAPTTSCCAACDAWASADSPCSSDAGKSFGT
jgi:hypothetical protein